MTERKEECSTKRAEGSTPVVREEVCKAKGWNASEMGGSRRRCRTHLFDAKLNVVVVAFKEPILNGQIHFSVLSAKPTAQLSLTILGMFLAVLGQQPGQSVAIPAQFR